MFGRSRFGDVQFGGPAETGYTAVLANVPRYRLVLFDSDASTVLYYLTSPISATWFRRVSEASQIKLQYPVGATGYASLEIGHWIKIYDETENVLDAFRITERTRYHGQNMIDVTGEGPLAGLADQFVNEKIYLDSENWTVQGVVNDLLGDQESPAVELSLQYINESLGDQDIGERTYRRQSILEIISALVKEFGGYLLCDADGGIRWYSTSKDWRYAAYSYPITAQPKHYLRTGKDLLSATVRENRNQMANRLYAIGAWETVHLDAPGYIDDATSIASYGLIPRFVQNTECKTAAELAKWAQHVLDWSKYPRLEIDIEAIDLTQRPESTDYRHIHIGHIIHCNIPELNINYEAPIYEMEIDLLRPEKISVKIAPIDAGTGMPELAGLSQQPYPMYSSDFQSSTAATVAASDVSLNRTWEGLFWQRYEP